MHPSSNRTGKSGIFFNTVSRIVLASVALSGLFTQAVQAEEIVYDGTDNRILGSEPTEFNSSRSSLRPAGSDLTNTITVKGPVTGEKTVWETSVAPYNVYGFSSIQTGFDSTQNGIAGASTEDTVVTIKDVQYDWSAPENKATDASKAGYIGGMGGGSTFGGLSVGAPGATAYRGVTSGQGGNGGDIKRVHVTLENVEIYGANAGNGYSFPTEVEQEGTSEEAKRGSTVGGMGGASVYGGLSIGGAGGWSADSTANNANGGLSGELSSNYVTVKDTNLYGGMGGNGGTYVGGSAGGMGGASVLGGVSIGGAGGIGYSGANNNSQGGATGKVFNNHVILNNVNMTGAEGGNGGSSVKDNTSGGTAGAGGGIVGGGLAIAGGGGFAGTADTAGTSNANGGDGGAVYDNEVNLTKVFILGADGGKGGDGAPDSGGGVGGMGGGLVFGGMTIGGAGGSGHEATSTNGNGGFANYVKSNSVTFNDVQIIGRDGGTGGATSTRGGGSGGAGGASVFGGLSMGGAGGFSDTGGTGGVASFTSSDADSIGANGGNSATVSYNTINLKDTTLDGGKGGDGGQGGGIGGMGGGSVVGGLSTGGGGGYSRYSKKYNGNGGDSGDVTNNYIKIVGSTLRGNDGGTGGAISQTITAQEDDPGKEVVTIEGSGAGGAGGGSVFGGLALGGSGGFGSQGGVKNGIGGDAGAVAYNTIILESVNLSGGQGGAGGSIGVNGNQGEGVRGSNGGSIYGGASVGGAGGVGYDATEINGAGGKGGDVTNNTITLTDVFLHDAGWSNNGNHNQGVYGGISIGGAGGFGDVTETEDKNSGGKGGNAGNVSSNTITISGKSVINKDVYGGFSRGGSAGIHFNELNELITGQAGLGGNANHNTITLKGDQIIIGEVDEGGYVGEYGSIWGGRSLDGNGTESKTADVFSGNTLNLNGYRGTVAGIHNFENYNWTLPADVKNGDTVIKIAEGGTPVDLTNTKHTIAGLDPNGPRFMAGDMVTMIDKSAGSWSPASYTLKQGQFIFYDTTLKQNKAGDNTAFILQINKKTDKTPGHDHGDDHDHTGDNTGDNGGGDHNNPGQSAAQLNPQSKTYSEGRAASLAFVSQGSDIIANSMGTISSLATRTDHRFNHPLYVPFIITGGSSSRYQTGSHVEIDGFNMIAGLAFGFNLEAGHKVTTGAFFEYGRGTYDTYNSFDRFASVKGDGDVDYKGGGILARIEFAGTGLGRVKDLKQSQTDGLYIDAALRFGQSSGKFDAGRNPDREFADYRGSYDTNVNYFGGHVTGGYVFNFDDKNTLDVYGRYLWTRLESDDVKINNEKLHFDSSTSSRIKLGTRYSYQYNDVFKPYIGAAYEYEFDGDIDARAYQFNLDKPSLEGSTGVFEAGFSMNPIRDNKALTINVDGQGYVGTRRGGGGSIKLKYEF